MMAILFFILATLAVLAGVAGFSFSRGAAHEIEALILILIGAVFLVGAGIVDAIARLRKDQKTRQLPT